MSKSPKELYQLNQAQTKRMRAVVTSIEFENLVMAAMAQLATTDNVTPEHLRGATLFKGILCDLPMEEATSENVGSGLRHDLDDPRPKEQQPKTEQPKV